MYKLIKLYREIQLYLYLFWCYTAVVEFRRIRDPSNEYRNKVPTSTVIYHSGRSFLEPTRPDILLKLLNFPPC